MKKSGLIIIAALSVVATATEDSGSAAEGRAA